jgi:hypothetical protein
VKFFSTVGLTIGLAGAAVWMYAQRRSQQTGRDITTVLSNLPEELKQTKSELQREMKSAMSAGKRAAAEKEAQIDRELKEAESGVPGHQTHDRVPEFVV